MGTTGLCEEPSAPSQGGDTGSNPVGGATRCGAGHRGSYVLRVPARVAAGGRRARCVPVGNTISCWPLLDSNGELVTRSTTPDNTGRWLNARSLARRQRPPSSPLPRRRTQPPRSHHPRRPLTSNDSTTSVSAGTTIGTSLPENRGPWRQTKDLYGFNPTRVTGSHPSHTPRSGSAIPRPTTHEDRAQPQLLCTLLATSCGRMVRQRTGGRMRWLRSVH
jgi:hypothetical protein